MIHDVRQNVHYLLFPLFFTLFPLSSLLLPFPNKGEAAVSRLEDLKKKILLANVLDWASYKLGVSITCSYIVRLMDIINILNIPFNILRDCIFSFSFPQSWGLCKLTLLKEQLGPLAKRLSAIVASDEFNSILVQLGLADPQALCDESQSPPTSAPLPRLSPGAVSHAHLMYYCIVIELYWFCDPIGRRLCGIIKNSRTVRHGICCSRSGPAHS